MCVSIYYLLYIIIVVKVIKYKNEVILRENLPTRRAFFPCWETDDSWMGQIRNRGWVITLFKTTFTHTNHLAIWNNVLIKENTFVTFPGRLVLIDLRNYLSKLKSYSPVMVWPFLKIDFCNPKH